MATEVVIISCKVNCCSFGCDNTCGIVIDSTSDPKIPIGYNCAKVMAKLLDDGFKLLNTTTIPECSEIVHTFVKSPPKPNPCPPCTNPKPEPCLSCSSEDSKDECNICN